jgi:hypothetical protein
LRFPPRNALKSQQPNERRLWPTIAQPVRQEVIQALIAMLIDSLLLRTKEEHDD